jgi:Trk K+ transport system NAD-binding subunit
MSARLSLIIAAAAIARDLGIISEAVNADIILIAIITCTVSPMIFNRTLPQKIELVRRGTILVGLGEMSILLAERLRLNDEPVTVVGLDRGRNRRNRRQDLPVIEGDPTDLEVLESAGAKTAASLVAMSTYDEINRKACHLAVTEFGIPHVIAQASDHEIAAQLLEHNVRVVRPQMATVLALEGALQFPGAFDMLTNHADGVELREVELRNPALFSRYLRHIRLPGDALVLGLRRRGEVLVPHGNTKLQRGDLVMLVGHRETLQQAIDRLNKAGR